MTPMNNSLYAVCLFLALSCLLRWTELRRQRVLRFRRSLAVAFMTDAERA
jgi:predicted membrane-bound mannosyltransferase